MRWSLLFCLSPIYTLQPALSKRRGQTGAPQESRHRLLSQQASCEVGEVGTMQDLSGCPRVPCSSKLWPECVIEKDPLYSIDYELTTTGLLLISLYIKSHLWEPCIPGNKHQAKIITLFGSQETSCPDSPVNHSREADINTCPLKPDQNEEIFDFPPSPLLRINIKEA